tara:strand:- start:203 stop:517 length:315 start_codon:yes stop_codon:yes gene_type:complete
MFKKIIYLIALIFLVTSCADSWDSVKRGLMGGKSKSTDEFLIKKKDPLILPPDYKNLPTPSERQAAMEEASNIEKKLKKTSSGEITSSTTSSAEESILQQIRKN